MARFFQLPNFRRDDYQRPDQKWVCGLSCDGKACPFGPDRQGRCHTTGECRPVKNADRWACTRAETHGGPCEEGPLPSGECCRQIGPCQPVVSIRARRGRWVGAAAAVTVGILLVLFASPGRGRWIDPGPLTSAHALSGTRCNDCHTSMGDGPAKGPGMFLAGVHRPASASCLRCHDLGSQPLSPHGFGPAALERIHRESPGAAMPASHSVVLALARVSPGTRGDHECILCHQEHHGRDSSLTRFTDQQCQVCHQATFESFSRGHPEFAGYPFRRRTRIVFDHIKHLQVHFAEKAVAASAPRDCDACHAPSAGGAFMLVKDFAQTCAACHGAQIEGEGRAGDKGIAFFRVPGLDAATLAARGHPVGEWPADAEGGLTPFVRLLLVRDPGAASALRTLEGVDLTDLRTASEDKLAAADTLAWDLKSLFADLVADGQGTMVARLGQIDPGADRAQLRAMTAQLPRDGLMAAQAAWFPSLFSEVAAYRAGIKPAPKAAAAPQAAVVPPPPPRPAGGDDLLDEKPAPPPKTAAADDLLAGDSPAADAKAPAKVPAPKAAADDLLGNDDVASDARSIVAVPPKISAAAVSPLKMNDAESWMMAGGWYRSAENLTLYYRPVGHADAFLTIWLTVAGRLSGDPRDRVAQSLFAALSDPKAPGLCIKCHSVDQGGADGARLVNWTGDAPRPGDHAITKFNHATHFSLLNQRGCQTCHQMKAQSSYLAGFDGNADPAKFESNFGPVAKATCAACHNDKVAREDCQLCHTYHTGEFAAKIAATGPMKPLP